MAMFACFPCGFQSEGVEEFEEHLRIKHKPKQAIDDNCKPESPLPPDHYDGQVNDEEEIESDKSYKCSQCDFLHNELDVVAKHFLEYHQKEDDSGMETVLFMDSGQVTIAHLVEETDQRHMEEPEQANYHSSHASLQDHHSKMETRVVLIDKTESFDTPSINDVHIPNEIEQVSNSHSELRGNQDLRVKEDNDDMPLPNEADEISLGEFEPIIQIRVESEQMKRECTSLFMESIKKFSNSKKLKLFNELNPDLVLNQSEKTQPKKRIRKKKVPFDQQYTEVKEEELSAEDVDPFDDDLEMTLESSKSQPTKSPNPPKRSRRKKIIKDDDEIELKPGTQKRGRKKIPDSQKAVYQCPQCIKSFKNKCDLQRHVSNIHLKLKPYECDRCHRTFGLLGNLKKHIDIVHFNKKRKNIKAHCQVCGNQYSSSHTLSLHMALVHEKERRFQCEYCGMKFGWSGCYERHIKSVHLQEKDFKCEVCGAAFARREHLRVHAKRHVPKEGAENIS